MQIIQPLVGLLLFLALAWALSENRRAIDWRIIPIGIAAQLLLALLMLKVPAVQFSMEVINQWVGSLVLVVEVGTTFIFGFLGGAPDPLTNPYPFEVSNPASTFIFAFRVLPIILVMTALSAVLWHLGLMQLLVGAFSLLLRHVLRVGGAVGLVTAANVFIGQVEAPALIRPYLSRLSRSELLIVITAGMATVSGSIMVLYAVILQQVVDNAIGHLLTASIISAPAAIMIARLMVPDGSQTTYDYEPDNMRYSSIMDAITRGTLDGTRIVVSVGAMVIVLVSLVGLVNVVLSVLPEVSGSPITLQRILGYLFAPLVLMMGVSLDDCLTASRLMGTKTVLNEVIAYQELAELPVGALSERSAVIMTYAMCGFANFGSMGIMIGGIGGLCPERRQEIVELTGRAMISATIATCMTGAVVALLI